MAGAPAARNQTGEGPEGAAAIRRLGYRDLPSVLAIERRSFDAPWSIAMFLSEMSRPGSVCLAATGGADELVGYLVCSRYERARHLNNVAVDRAHRRSGIGSRLIEAMLAEIPGDDELTLEVRPSNRGAIALYERYGFREVARRSGYYPDNREDALIMSRTSPPEGPRAGQAEEPRGGGTAGPQGCGADADA